MRIPAHFPGAGHSLDTKQPFQKETMMIRVAVTGAKGRMGSTVVAAVTGAPDMEVVLSLIHI